SDRPEDIHSPLQGGFWWAHMGWILSPDHEKTDFSRVPDLAKYPELVWLDRHQFLPTLLYAVALSFAFGPVGLFYGYLLSTVLLWHGTFSVNSIMHVFGRRAYATTDDSRNSFLISLITMGEGWHNNHHWAPSSAAQGFRWWQWDGSWYVLWLAERVGLVRGVRRPPARWRGAAGGAVVEVEAAGGRAAAQLDHLHEEAAVLGARAGKRLEEIHREIERVRAHLVEILRRRVATAESLSLGQADPQPG